jgi:hypothetical protein
MGHVRLGVMPKSRKWKQVVGLVTGGASAPAVAGAAMEAAQQDLARLSGDPALVRAVWLLAQVPLAAREKDFAAALAKLGVHVSGSSPTTAELVAEVTRAIDARVEAATARSDLGEMAQAAALEVLAHAARDPTPGLFGPDPHAAQRALADRATEAQFAGLVRDFFSRFSEKFLGYYLSRALPLEIGGEGRFASLAEHREFNEALATHARQSALIVEKFAGGWWSKSRIEGGITEDRTARFVAYSLKKIRDELAMGASE